MMTEFEVRRRMSEIRASQIAPMRKARLLLRLGRSLNAQIRMLSHAKAQLARTADRNASAGLSRMALRTKLLHEDVRDLAWMEIKASARPKFLRN